MTGTRRQRSNDMTKVDFYILPEHAQGDRYLLACRLLDKIHAQGRRAYVNVGSDPEARHLDRLLWTFRQNSFIPHGMIGEADSELTPVLIGWNRDPDAEEDVLVNLAAEQGDAYAQYNFAKLSDEGVGVEQSYEKALYWYRKAAIQGQANAQYSLGEMYLDGLGVERDSARAYAWIYVLVRGGVEAAEPILEEIELDMTTDENEEAQRLAEEYWNKYGSHE